MSARRPCLYALLFLTASTRASAQGEGGLERYDEQLVRDSARSVRAATLVVEVVARRVLLPSPTAELAVTSVLKGSTEEESVSVRLSKAPVGRWPREGETRIFCLTPVAEGGFELAGHHACILPATDAARESVRTWARGGPAGKAPAPREARPNPYLRQAAASDTVLAGAITDLRPADGERPGALGAFAVEGALFGYGAFRAPVSVRFMAPPEGGALPRPGRYLLFLIGSPTGPGFVVVEAVRLTDPASEAEAKRLALEALGGRTARLTTVQATVAEWQDSWNARDISRCIVCYSRESRLRRRYESGGEARRGLGRQIRDAPGTVAIAVERIRVILAPTKEGARETAEVEVALTLAPRAGEERRERATMRFVREAGEWLILEEGF